jgi:hypothetical protein
MAKTLQSFIRARQKTKYDSKRRSSEGPSSRRESLGMMEILSGRYQSKRRSVNLEEREFEDDERFRWKYVILKKVGSVRVLVPLQRETIPSTVRTPKAVDEIRDIEGDHPFRFKSGKHRGNPSKKSMSSIVEILDG